MKEIVDFFIELFELETLEFSRSLWPPEDVDGKPELVCLCQRSERLCTFVGNSYQAIGGRRW